jgi:hypothetical protein
MTKAKKKAYMRNIRRMVVFGYIIPMVIHTLYKEYKLVKGE